MSNDNSISPELKFWSIFTVAHAAATIVVTISAALWWVQDYEETFMRGDKVIEPPLLHFLNVLAKGLQLPLFPLIYSPTSQTKDFPAILAVFFNSAIAALLALIVWRSATRFKARHFR